MNYTYYVLFIIFYREPNETIKKSINTQTRSQVCNANNVHMEYIILYIRVIDWPQELNDRNRLIYNSKTHFVDDVP